MQKYSKQVYTNIPFVIEITVMLYFFYLLKWLQVKNYT